MKAYKPISDREVARRLGVRSIRTVYYYLQTIQEIYDAGLIICERVSTDRPQGEWIYCEDDEGQDGYRCSECGFFVPWYYDYEDSNYILDYKACPHCLARMKGAGDE